MKACGRDHHPPSWENNRLAVYAAHTEPVYESCKISGPSPRASGLYAVHGRASADFPLHSGAPQGVTVRVPCRPPYPRDRALRPDRGTHYAGFRSTRPAAARPDTALLKNKNRCAENREEGAGSILPSPMLSAVSSSVASAEGCDDMKKGPPNQLGGPRKHDRASF
jgi:hypothetical protein